MKRLQRSQFLKRMIIALILALPLASRTANAWEWSDFVGNGGTSDSRFTDVSNTLSKTLSIQEVSDMRVRDIKRRLARHHGYSAEELGRILDKKELIHALAFEEEKLRLDYEDGVKRQVIQRSIIYAIVGVLVALCWPLLRHAYEVAAVNFVVYTDRKKHEAMRCLELRSWAGLVGVTLMFVLDLLQSWLSVSVLLSWFMRSRYFFPTKWFSLPISPGRLMGLGSGGLASYGINIGPMIITWLLRFLHGRLEGWTGRALSRAHQAQRKATREMETPEDKAARKAARKEAKRLAKQQQQQHQLHQQQKQKEQAAVTEASKIPDLKDVPQEDFLSELDRVTNNETTSHNSAAPLGRPIEGPFSTPETSKATTTAATAKPGFPIHSKTHEEFLRQLESHTSELDDLD